MGRVKRSGVGAPLPFFLLLPRHLPLGLLFLLSLFFLHHNKDGGYNGTNINKQLSPAQNTPALQATTVLCFSDMMNVLSSDTVFPHKGRADLVPKFGTSVIFVCVCYKLCWYQSRN